VGRFADTQVLSPAPRVAFRGRIAVDGTEVALDGEPGCQSHLWGRRHAHEWAWARCSSFADRSDAFIEALTVRIRRGRVFLPPITLVSLHVGNRDYHFREIYDAPFSRGSWGTGRYHFVARGLGARIEAEFNCRPEDLVLARYADPDGSSAFCHNTEVADCKVTLSLRRALRFRKVVTLTAKSTGHFEYGGREPDPAVTREHEAV